jgi:membrane fusion protein (multidrug efflux system)
METEARSSKKSYGLVLFLVLAILAGGGFYYWKAHQGSSEGGGGRSAGAGGGLPPAVVTAEVVTARDMPLTLEYVGQTAGLKAVEVRARVGGILLRRTYVEGRPVRQGQLLFLIDPAPYRAALDKALGNQGQCKADLDRAKIELDRVTALFAKKALSQKDLDDATKDYNSAVAALDAARAAVQEARIDLGYTRVTAPVSGISSKETRSEGNLITTDASGSLLTTINQVDPLYVDFAIPSDEAAANDRLRAEGKLRTEPQGVRVQIVLGDGSSYARLGRINFQDQQVDPSTGSIRARATFPNPGGQVLPGQFARVRLLGNYLHQAIVVPQRAVLETQQGNLVYVLTSGDVAQPRPVTVAMSLGDGLVIEKGLAAGERIVTDGVIKVAPNARVLVVSADAGQKP